MGLGASESAPPPNQNFLATPLGDGRRRKRTGGDGRKRKEAGGRGGGDERDSSFLYILALDLKYLGT